MTEDNSNQIKIKALEEKLKTAYSNDQFSEVKSLAAELKGLDPGNHAAEHLLGRILEKEQEANRKAHAAEINALQDVAQTAFKKGDAQAMEEACGKLIKLEPENSVVKKLRAKMAEAGAALEKKKREAALPKGGEGNLFTRLFGKKEEAVSVPQAKSIIDTIVSEAGKPLKPEKAEHKKDVTGLTFLRFSHAFLQFTIVFVLISAAFFAIENKDVENWVLGFVKKESYASRLHNAAVALEAKQEEVRTLDRDIKRFEEGYNNRYEEVIRQIVEKRLNWPDILQKINEITDTIYERNALSQYIQYTSFTFDAEKGLIRVSGTLTDPLGKNLTKLAELEQAFRTYPKNPDDPNDKTEPYFYDFQEFSSLRKSLDKKTNKYTSSFQLSFALKPQAKK